ncbi:hypothetical protein CHARACLAT_010557 [Characodon lateralis]|uniref:Uncharacterized protein n=1 Tax=Characodon lateralis TaxID=208331 RepID=A0ABU7DU00_9TELE|nr:hypothetical protein [Characodon lateralis]
MSMKNRKSTTILASRTGSGRARGIPQEVIRTLSQPEDFKLSSVHLHLTEGSPSPCLRLLADWIRTIDLQIYLDGESCLTPSS